MDGNPMASLEHSQLFVIFQLRSLNCLDGKQISEELRQMADKRFAQGSCLLLNMFQVKQHCICERVLLSIFVNCMSNFLYLQGKSQFLKPPREIQIDSQNWGVKIAMFDRVTQMQGKWLLVQKIECFGNQDSSVHFRYRIT